MAETVTAAADAVKWSVVYRRHATMSTRRRFLLTAPLGLLASTRVASGWLARPAPLPEGQPVTSMPDAARAELAPNGRLRAALNYSNFLLVSSRAPEHTGVAPDLARELARRANAVVEFVGYENAGLAADGARDRAWDVAFIGAEPARAGEITFTPAYVEIEATYLVRADAPIRSIDDVDREGVRIATTARAAYTLYLQRTLRHATLVEADGIQGIVRAVRRLQARRARRPEAATPRGREEDSRGATPRGTFHGGAAVDRRAEGAHGRGGLPRGLRRGDQVIGTAQHADRTARREGIDDREGMTDGAPSGRRGSRQPFGL